MPTFGMAAWAVRFSALLACARGLELTSETWDQTTKGKTVFIKFFAPWCASCKETQPAWAQLMQAYEDSASIIVAEVDCPAEKVRPFYLLGSGDDLCSKNDVKAYPSLKYGKPGVSTIEEGVSSLAYPLLEMYNGSRDIHSLMDFAEQNLGPACGPAHLELCSKTTRQRITTLLDMDGDSLAAALVNAEQAVRAAELREWTVHIQRKDGMLFGMGIKGVSDGLDVTKIEDGAVKLFNSANPVDAIQVGDRIARVNAVTDVDAMKQAFKSSLLDLLVQRQGSEETKSNAQKESGLLWIKLVQSFAAKKAHAAKTEL